MTVAELIAKLQEFPSDMTVMIDDDDLGFVDVESVGRGAIYDDDNIVVVLNYINSPATQKGDADA